MRLTDDIVKKELKRGRTVIEIAKKYKVTRQAVYCHIDRLKKKKKKEYNKPRKNYNHLINWKVYNEGLVKRGEILLDFDIFNNLETELKMINENKKGRPYEFPDNFILFFLRLKSIFKIDYRTLEGIARKLVIFIPEANKAPDYTTFNVRLKKLGQEIEIIEQTEQQDIAGDSSGLKTSNSGEYRMNKHRGKRKKFVKLHLAVNIKNKQIVYCNVTKEEVRDGAELPAMISKTQRYGEIKNGLFDAGYDSIKNYGLLKEKGINPVIRPRRSGKLERVKNEISKIENNKIELENIKGRYTRLKILEEYLTDEEKWKEKNDYGKRWAVEGSYSVFKRMFNEHTYSKRFDNIQHEVIIKINLMNIFSSFLRKGSYKDKIVKDTNLENHIRTTQSGNQAKSMVLLMAMMNGCKKQNDLLCNISKKQTLGEELDKKEQVGN